MSNSDDQGCFSGESSVASGGSVSLSSGGGDERRGARSKATAKFRHGRPARAQLANVASIKRDRRQRSLSRASSEEEAVESKASANASSEDLASDVEVQHRVLESDIIAHNYRQLARSENQKMAAAEAAAETGGSANRDPLSALLICLRPNFPHPQDLVSVTIPLRAKLEEAFIEAPFSADHFDFIRHLCEAHAKMATLHLVHVSRTLDAEFQRLTISLRQWKEGVVGRDASPHYRRVWQEMGTSRDAIFERFVDPERLSRNYFDERACVVRRNRGYLRYLGAIDYLRQHDEDHFTGLEKAVKGHLLVLDQQMKLPTYNHLDGVSDKKEGDNFEL